MQSVASNLARPSDVSVSHIKKNTELLWWWWQRELVTLCLQKMDACMTLDHLDGVGDVHTKSKSK